jgi:hypothetical protein
MPLKQYVVGAEVRVSATYTVAGVLTDPTTVTVRIKTPGGTKTTYVYGQDGEVVRDSTGAYHLDVTASVAGYWHYRFEGTGVAAGAKESKFNVNSSAFV